MYLPAEGRDALLQSGAAAGEEVATAGSSKMRWEAERISNDPPVSPEASLSDETDQLRSGRSPARPLPDKLFAEPESESNPDTSAAREAAQLPAAGRLLAST